MQLPGEICEQADSVGKALNTIKQSLSLQKSAEGIVPKKKSGRPEHEEKDMNGTNMRMQRVQKIQKKMEPSRGGDSASCQGPM